MLGQVSGLHHRLKTGGRILEHVGKVVFRAATVYTVATLGQVLSIQRVEPDRVALKDGDVIDDEARQAKPRAGTSGATSPIWQVSGGRQCSDHNTDRTTCSFSSMPPRPPHQTAEEPDREEVENAGAKPRGLH